MNRPFSTLSLAGTDPHDIIAQAVQDASGMVLGRSKDYLVDARLKSILARFELDTLHQLAQRIRSGDREVLNAVVDRMTINESFFFRDQRPFTVLRDEVLPAISRLARPGAAPRIWSAACSAGQEPFSVSILLAERHMRAEILATDISPTVLGRAERGVYSDFEIGRGVEPGRRDRFFERVEAGWRVREAVRGPIRFARHNLVKDQPSGRFELILCRNVLIYFDEPTKRAVLRKLTDALQPGGMLMLGGAETALDADPRLAPGPGGFVLVRR